MEITQLFLAAVDVVQAVQPDGLSKYLLAAITAETTVICFLFGIVLKGNMARDKKLSDCEQDRKLLSIQVLDQQREVTNIWKHLAETARAQLVGMVPPMPPKGAA